MSANVEDIRTGISNNKNTCSVDVNEANFDNMSVNSSTITTTTAMTGRSLHTPRSNFDLRSMQSAQSLENNEDSDRDSVNFDRDHEEINEHDEIEEKEDIEEREEEEGYQCENRVNNDSDNNNNNNVKKREIMNEQNEYELQENEFARLQQYEYEPEITQGQYEVRYPEYQNEEQQEQREISMEYPSGSSDDEYDAMLLNLELNALVDMEETNRLLIRCDEYDERRALKQEHTAFTNIDIKEVNKHTNVEVDEKENKFMPLSLEYNTINKQETQYVTLENRNSSNNNNNIKEKKDAAINSEKLKMDVNMCEPTRKKDKSNSSSSENDNNDDDYYLHHYSDDADVDDSKLNIMKRMQNESSNDEYSGDGSVSNTNNEKQDLQDVFLPNEEQSNRQNVEDANELINVIEEEEKDKMENNRDEEKDNEDVIESNGNVIKESEESNNMNNNEESSYNEDDEGEDVEETDDSDEDDEKDDEDEDQNVESMMELEHIRQFFWPINIAALSYNDRPRLLLNVNAACEEKCGCQESEHDSHYSYFSHNKRINENDSYNTTQLYGESYDTYNELGKVEQISPTSSSSSSSYSSVYRWFRSKAYSFLDYWQSGNDLNIIGGYGDGASILPALRIQEEEQEQYDEELLLEECYYNNNNSSNASVGASDKKQEILSNNNNKIVKYRSSRSSMNSTTPSHSDYSHHSKKTNNYNNNYTHYKSSKVINKTHIHRNEKNSSKDVLQSSPNQALCAHMTPYPSYGTSDVANEFQQSNDHKKKRKSSQSFLYDTNQSHESNWSTHDSHATDKVLLHSPITVRNLQLLWIATTTRQYLFSFLSFVYVSLLFAQGLLWIMLDTLPLSSPSFSTMQFMQPTSGSYIYSNINNKGNNNKSNNVTTSKNFIIFLFKYCQTNRVTLMEAVSFGVIGFTILLQFLTCGISAVHLTRMPHILLCIGGCMAIASALLIKQSVDRKESTFLITGAVVHGCGTGFGLIGCLICAMTEMGIVAGMSVQLQIMLLAWFVSSSVVYSFAPTMYNNNHNYYNMNDENDDAINSIGEKEWVLELPLYLACTSLLFAFALICLVRSKVIERAANAYKHHFRTSKLINAIKGVSVRFIFRSMACVFVTSVIAVMTSSCEVLLNWPFDLVVSTNAMTNTQQQEPSTSFKPFQVEGHQPIVFTKDANGHLLYSSVSSTPSSSSFSYYSTLDVQLKHSASSCRLISLLFVSVLLTWPFCLIPGKCFALTGQFVMVTILVLLTATCWTVFTSHVWPITLIHNTEPSFATWSPSASSSLPLNKDNVNVVASNTITLSRSEELFSITPSPQAHIWLVASVICTGLCCTLLFSGILQSLIRVGLTFNTSNNKLCKGKYVYRAIHGNATSSVRSSKHSQRTHSYRKSSKATTQSQSCVSTSANSYASQMQLNDNYTTQLQITKNNENAKSRKGKDLLVVSLRADNNHLFEHLEQELEQNYCNNEQLGEQVELCNDSYVLDGKAIEVNSIENIRSRMRRDLRDGPASTLALSITLVILLLFTCGLCDGMAALILRHAAHTQVHTQSELFPPQQEGSTSTVTTTKNTKYIHSPFFASNTTVQGYLELLLMIDVISWLAVGCVLGEMVFINRINLRKIYAHIVSFLSLVIDYVFCCCFTITEREQVNEYDV